MLDDRSPLNPINSTLLSLFRLFVWLQVGLSATFVLARLTSSPERSPLTGVGRLLIFVALILYLQSSYLQRRLREAYLPVALAAVTIGLSLGRPLLQLYNLSAGAGPLGAILQTLSYGEGSTLWDTESTPMLFFPLVLIAWQYKLKEIVLFIVATISIDVGYYALITAHYWPDALSNMVLAIGTRSITFLFVGYIVTVLAQILKEQRNALQQANRKLVHYVTALDQLATSRERNRLARELHDTLAHSLSATAIQLEACNALWDSNADKAHDLLLQSLATTRAGLSETRRALEALRAAPLDDLGLLLSLRQLALAGAEQAGYQLQLDLPDQLESMPVEVEQTLYRCAQEVLANVGRHAAATHVRLRLDHQDSQVELEIADDGRGFDLATVDRARHFGIVGMQERVEVLGGQLTIDSQPGRGTTVRLRMGARS